MVDVVAVISGCRVCDRKQQMAAMIAVLVSLCCCDNNVMAQLDSDGWELVRSRRIWNQGRHNAFTDLVRFKNQWVCVFREGAAHVSPDGSLRVIVSEDAKEWKSAALITMADHDLRDAKISVTPKGELMLVGAGAKNGRDPYHHQTFAWFSADGRKWSKAHPIGDRNSWLWRVTWNKKMAYGFGYETSGEGHELRFFQSSDGRTFKRIIDNAFPKGYPNETQIVFTPDQKAICLLRRDASDPTAQLGTASPPYTQWKWQDLGVRVGGPSLMRLNDGRLMAIVRLYDGGARTSLCEIDATGPKLIERLRFPSGGDTSYAGMVWQNDLLWVSYYSSHEGRTMIYFAQVRQK